VSTLRNVSGVDAKEMVFFRRVSSISPKSIVSGEAYVLFYEQEGQKSHL
jgi:hypothetical protein